jgi:type I restriction enzyme S subunit
MKMDKNLHIPQGYRQTEVGVIPDDWSKLELNDIFNISSKKFNPIVSSENKKCIELEHLSQNTGVLLGFTNSKEQLSIKNIFTKGQILYGKLRPYLRKYWQSEFSGVCSSEIWVLNNKKITNKYLFQFIQTNKFNQVANVSTGSKMPRADWKYMSQIPFIIPPKQEQQKIADILTTWDNAINQQTTLIEKKQQLKKGLMQQLLTYVFIDIKIIEIGCELTSV